MKRTLKSKSLLCALALTAALSLSAQEFNQFLAQPAGSMKIEGTSTIHDWIMEGQIIGGWLKLAKGFELDASAKPGKVEAQAQVSIPVRSLKSGKSTMDEIMQQAMNETSHGKIEYKLSELVLKEVPSDVKNPFKCESTGELTINGKTKKITMPVELVKINPVRLEVRGKTVVKMTDYEVKPPNPNIAGIGIKTGEDVTLSFTWKVAMKVEAPKPADK
jgi:polyisoprenoid-binding protein YceI